MSAMASQFISLTIVYSSVYSGADQRKHQSSASLAFVRGIHRWPVNSSQKRPVTGKMCPFDDVIVAAEGFAGFSVALVYWSRRAERCYASQRVIVYIYDSPSTNGVSYSFFLARVLKTQNSTVLLCAQTCTLCTHADIYLPCVLMHLLF